MKYKFLFLSKYLLAYFLFHDAHSRCRKTELNIGRVTMMIAERIFRPDFVLNLIEKKCKSKFRILNIWVFV